MEESYETFEEELWPPRAEPPPEKPVRQIRRSEMHASRTVMEEGIPVQQQPRSEHKTLPREPSFAKTSSLRKSFSIQNLTQIETPWENVTLNRCLFVAITILVLTSGCQRLHEAFCGEGKEKEEEAALTRRSGILRHRGQLPEPETSLWEVMFSWLPNLDDEDDDEDDDEKIKKGKSKRKVTTRELRGLRNRRLPDKKLLKQKDEKLKDKRARKAGDEEVKDKKGRVEKEDPEEAEEEKDEEDEQMAPKKIKLEEKKDKKKIKKG